MGEERIEVNIPDFTLRLMDGDNAGPRRARHRRQAGHADAGLLQRDAIYSGQPGLAGAGFDHQEGDGAQTRGRSRLSDPPRLRGHAGRRPYDRQPAAWRGQRARPHPVHVPQRACRLSARHALAGAVRLGAARVQPRLRARRAADAARRTGDGRRRARDGPARACNRCVGKSERTVLLPHPIPIHLEYFTEFVDESGALQDREDIYGITRRVAGTIATHESRLNHGSCGAVIRNVLVVFCAMCSLGHSGSAARSAEFTMWRDCSVRAPVGIARGSGRLGFVCAIGAAARRKSALARLLAGRRVAQPWLCAELNRIGDRQRRHAHHRLLQFPHQ